MKYDFTTYLDRTNTSSIAVDLSNSLGGVAIPPCKDGFDPIPMWIADMTLKTAPCVINKITERLGHEIFGYTHNSEEYYNAIINWHAKRKNVTDLKPCNIGYENGVMGGVLSALRTLCSTGDKILIHSPTYLGFTMSLSNAGYKMIHSSLFLDENNIWRMNFEDMEEKIKNQKIHAMVFCSPHNPCGRVYEKWEIEKVVEICEKYDVYIVADEIWSDIILDGNKHIPTQSVSEQAKNRTIALYAPSKTFNIAGLVGAYHVIYNQRLNDRVLKESSISHYNETNILSMQALMGAYSDEGHEWADELCKVLSQNINDAYEFFTKKVSGIKVTKPQATYLLFIDCTKWLEDHNKTLNELISLGYEYGIMWQSGEGFNGKNCIRINFALPHHKVIESLDRLDKYVFNS